VITNSVARKVVGVEYTLLRAPLDALDRRLAARLGEDSKVCTTLERGLGGLDAVAARLLGGGSAASAPAHEAPAPEAPEQAAPEQAAPEQEAPEQEAPEEAAREQAAPEQVAADDTAAPADAATATADSPGAVIVDATETLDESPEATEERVEEEVERVSEELVTELAEKPLVGELADAGEDEIQRMADLRARHIVEQYEAEQAAKHGGS
jgi:hypothetical protein